MKILWIMLLFGILFSACSPKKPLVKTAELNVSIEEKIDNEQIEQKVEENTTMIQLFKEEVLEEPVLAEALTLSYDIQSSIESLTLSEEERDVLNIVYKRANYKAFWNKRQVENFDEILREDKYLSVCGAESYVNEIESMGMEEKELNDLLHSILLLKYINNLNSGCEAWVFSKEEKKNSLHGIESDYLFAMLKKGALVEKLFLPYYPKNEDEFLYLIQEYKVLKSSTVDLDSISDEHLKIEKLKKVKKLPSYK